MPFNDNHKFINPYTFVSVDYQSRSTAVKSDELYTGVLDCRLITKTPIAIPDHDSATYDTAEHASYEFMFQSKKGGKKEYFIPGSSIRGVIRSEYETLTNSCFSTDDSTEVITYRNAGTGFKAGIIKKTDKNSYELWEAKRYIFKVIGHESINKKNGKISYTYKPFSKCPGIFSVPEAELSKYQYGQKVMFSGCLDEDGNNAYKPLKGRMEQLVGYYIGDIMPQTDIANDNYDHTGYICIGEPFNNVKHFESVFEFKDNGLVARSDETGTRNNLSESIKTLDKIIEMYNNPKINSKLIKGKTVYSNRQYKDMKEGDCFPIWYKTSTGSMSDSEGNKSDFLYIDISVADLGRAAYGKDMGKLLNKKKACSSRRNLCEACNLFGFVASKGKSGDSAIASKLRFTDAHPCEPISEEYIQKRVVLRELAGPKPSYLPFYSAVKDNQGKLKKINRNEWSYNNDEVELRGRKFYWHYVSKDAYRAPNNEKTKRNETMDLVGSYGADGNHKSVTFEFSVFYDSVTKNELEKLKWVLTLGTNDACDKHCHKIGHGKPIGLGSVKIVIDRDSRRNFSNGEYSVSYEEDVKISNGDFFEPSVKNDILTVTSLDACNDPVSYPYVADEVGVRIDDSNNNKYASHVWFSNNFQLGSKPPHYILPKIGEQNDISFGVFQFGENNMRERPNNHYQKNGRNQRSNDHRGRYNGNTSQKAYRKSYDVGDIFEGTVSNLNNDRRFAYVTNDNGDRVSYYCEGKATVGIRVKLKKTGVNEKGFDIWKLLNN